MGWNEIMAPIENHNKQVALQSAWGHLAPKKNVSYKGTIQIYHSGFPDQCGIDYEFDGLESSPWLYDYINRLVADWHLPYYGLWEMTGTFRNYNFNATPKLIHLGIDKNKVDDPTRKSIRRKKGEDGLFNGWETVTLMTIPSNGKPIRVSKSNVSVNIFDVYNQKTYDLAHKIKENNQ